MNERNKATLKLLQRRLNAVPFYARISQNFLRPLSHWKLISKLISKFMLIVPFERKISSENSQNSKEIYFESEFRNLEHVLFCEISPKKFRLWSAPIGQSASVYKHRIKRRLRQCVVHRCRLSKVYFQCERAHFRKKNSKFFFQN